MNTSIFCTEGRDEENSETESGLRSTNKEWNFGLTEYADTVGPQGERCRLKFHLRYFISGLNFLLNGQTGTVRKCMWLVIILIGSYWCIRNIRKGYFLYCFKQFACTNFEGLLGRLRADKNILSKYVCKTLFGLSISHKTYKKLRWAGSLPQSLGVS